MANGWTNANNFKPWTQYDITPGAEDIVIPKGSYLNQNITVHGDPNYASCNIVQGASVGDIQYGSANTPVDSFGGGVYYPKEERTPYVILENLAYNSLTNTIIQKTTDFHGHMCVYADSNIVCGYPKLNKYNYCRTNDINHNDRWEKKSLGNFSMGRIYSGTPNEYSVPFTMFANLNNGNPIGYYTYSMSNYEECNLNNPSSYTNYYTCFLLPISNSLNTEISFIGLIRNGNSYAIITSKIGDKWDVNRTFTLAQDFVGVDRSGYETYILFSGGSLYQFSEGQGGTKDFIISKSNYDMIDYCTNKDANTKQLAISKNKIYSQGTNDWVEVTNVSDVLIDNGIQIDSTLNYTEWITYLEEYDIFVVGSSDTPYVITIGNNNEINWYTDLSFIEYGLKYLPCHCFTYIEDSNVGKVVIFMYYNFIYVLHSDGGYNIYPATTLRLRIRG